MYVINQDLAPLIKSMLNDSIQTSNTHVFYFDEKRGYADLQNGYVHKILE